MYIFSFEHWRSNCNQSKWWFT